MTEGESPQDRRLARATLQLADLQREAADKRRHGHWQVPLLVVAVFAGALVATLAGRVPLALALWVLGGLVAAASLDRGERVARIRTQATAAAAEARAYLRTTAPRVP